MKIEFIVKVKLNNKDEEVTVELDTDDLIENDNGLLSEILSKIEEYDQNNNCCCTFSESQNHCDCDCGNWDGDFEVINTREALEVNTKGTKHGWDIDKNASKYMPKIIKALEK